jgi:ubiquinone/menaquinone biosynthesis C-methylase UbiE
MTAAQPYSRLAPFYDDYVGRRHFARARRGFEACVRRHRLTFRCAADVCCGTGLFARYLRERFQVPVFAVDRSPEMLRVALRNCRGSGVRLLRQDVRRLALPYPVELIVVQSFTMNQFPTDLSCVLERIWCNLCPGAFFLWDLLTPRQQWLPRQTRHVRERILRRRDSVCLAMTIQFPGHRERTREVHCARLYKPAEMTNELERAGFRLLDALDGANFETASEHSPAILFLARKPRSSRER